MEDLWALDNIVTCHDEGSWVLVVFESTITSDRNDADVGDGGSGAQGADGLDVLENIL